MSLTGHVALMGENMNEYPEGKKPLGGPSCMWEDRIKIDVREIGFCGLD
jgi:hypothetical protein